MTSGTTQPPPCHCPTHGSWQPQAPPPPPAQEGRTEDNCDKTLACSCLELTLRTVSAGSGHTIRGLWAPAWPHLHSPRHSSFYNTLTYLIPGPTWFNTPRHHLEILNFCIFNLMFVKSNLMGQWICYEQSRYAHSWVIPGHSFTDNVHSDPGTQNSCEPSAWESSKTHNESSADMYLFGSKSADSWKRPPFLWRQN